MVDNLQAYLPESWVYILAAATTKIVRLVPTHGHPKFLQFWCYRWHQLQAVPPTWLYFLSLSTLPTLTSPTKGILRRFIRIFHGEYLYWRANRPPPATPVSTMPPISLPIQLHPCIPPQWWHSALKIRQALKDLSNWTQRWSQDDSHRWQSHRLPAWQWVQIIAGWPF